MVLNMKSKSQCSFQLELQLDFSVIKQFSSVELANDQIFVLVGIFLIY